MAKRVVIFFINFFVFDGYLVDMVETRMARLYYDNQAAKIQLFMLTRFYNFLN